MTWATGQYYNPPTSALKALKIPLKVGSLSPYFIDDIGNVSTSRFRSNFREANLELKPRYPVFGGWNYSFRVGWDANLRRFLRKLKQGDGHVLKVPFLEGPKMSEGISYERVELRVILPEGATNVKYQSPISIISEEISTHMSFMDTLGRTSLKLTAINLIDEARDKDLIVSLLSLPPTTAFLCPPKDVSPLNKRGLFAIQVTYDYPFIAAFRKPITVFLGVASVFVTAWAIAKLDISIAGKLRPS